MTETLRLGVIGVGHLGHFHARKYAALCREQPGLELVGVADISPEQAGKVAAETGCTAFADFHELIGRVDAVSIATTTTSHFEVGRCCLENGVDVMMEKPITVTLDEANTLVDLAKRRGRVLQVGLIERFNPALRAALPHIDRPFFITARRLAPFTRRGTDVDVVLDLMIHDLDIALALAGAPVRRISAVGAAVLTDHHDIADAHLLFANGCTARLNVSRVAENLDRRMRVFQPGTSLNLNFQEKTCTLTRFPADLDAEATCEALFPPAHETVGDALEAELRAFVGCVRDRRQPEVSGAQGRDALAVALDIIRAARENAGKGRA